MSSGIALADSAMQGMCGGVGVGAQPAQHLEAVDVGQLHVHQDQVGPALCARLTPLRPSPAMSS